MIVFGIDSASVAMGERDATLLMGQMHMMKRKSRI